MSAEPLDLLSSVAAVTLTFCSSAQFSVVKVRIVLSRVTSTPVLVMSMVTSSEGNFFRATA